MSVNLQLIDSNPHKFIRDHIHQDALTCSRCGLIISEFEILQVGVRWENLQRLLEDHEDRQLAQQQKVCGRCTVCRGHHLDRHCSPATLLELGHITQAEAEQMAKDELIPIQNWDNFTKAMARGSSWYSAVHHDVILDADKVLECITQAAAMAKENKEPQGLSPEQMAYLKKRIMDGFADASGLTEACKCECGATKCGDNQHSSWCPVAKR